MMRKTLRHREGVLQQKIVTEFICKIQNSGSATSETQQKSLIPDAVGRSDKQAHDTAKQEMPEKIPDKFSNKNVVQATLHSLDTQERLSQSRGDKQFNEVEETSLIMGSLMGRRIFNYIEQVSHMDDVRKSQEKVLQIKERLRDFGENKRNILRRLDDVRHDLQRIYNDLKYSNSKASDRYLQLVKEEVDLYRKEKELQDDFKTADEQERLLFNAFSVAINDSYEKEKIHTNFIKVWGLIGTLLASTVTLIGAVISHYHHQSKFATLAKDLRQGVSKDIDDDISKKFSTLERTLVDGIAKLDGQRRVSSVGGESWGSYLKRHTRWIYAWAMPRN